MKIYSSLIKPHEYVKWLIVKYSVVCNFCNFLCLLVFYEYFLCINTEHVLFLIQLLLMHDHVSTKQHWRQQTTIMKHSRNRKRTNNSGEGHVDSNDSERTESVSVSGFQQYILKDFGIKGNIQCFSALFLCMFVSQHVFIQSYIHIFYHIKQTVRFVM